MCLQSGRARQLPCSSEAAASARLLTLRADRANLTASPSLPRLWRRYLVTASGTPTPGAPLPCDGRFGSCLGRAGQRFLPGYGYLVNFVRPIRRFSDGASPSSPLRRNWGAPPPTLAPRHPPRPPRPPNRRPAAAWPSTTSETYPETSAFNLSDRSVFQAFSLAARPVDYSHARRPPSPRPAPYVVSDPRAAISPRLGPHGALLGR